MKTIWLLEYLKKHYLPKWIVLVGELLIISATFVFAYLLNSNFEIKAIGENLLLTRILIQLLVYTLCIIVFRPFASIFRLSTIKDAAIILKSSSVAFFILLTLSLGAKDGHISMVFYFPVSILLIQYTLSCAIIISMQIAVNSVYKYMVNKGKGGQKVLIFGAGETGFVTLKVLLNESRKKYIVAGFIDDNAALHGRMIDGVTVFHTRKLTSKFVEQNEIESLIFAVDDSCISRSRTKVIYDTALKAGLEVFKVPSSELWINNQLQVHHFKKIKVEDLLGRNPIKLSLNKIKHTLCDKVILVTGAAGSIGSEIVRQLIRCKVKKLVLLDQAESPLYDLQNELKLIKNGTELNVVIANVANIKCLRKIFEEFQPQVVFNAAAYKHVPLMEDHPREAINVNVGGTRNTADLAVEYQVEKFIMISTDKAVNPTNVMGASKRMCEIYIQALSCKPGVKTQFITTRFGNVLGSNGSVVPLFSKQIENGGPVTLTHKEITRYFMTIPEACQLVLEAASMGKGGEIYVFDMGKPVRIYELAEKMIRLSGLEPDKEIKIEITGLRPGEKLYEELLATKENTLPTYHDKIMIAKVRDVKYEIVAPVIMNLLDNIYEKPMMAIVSIMKKLVPEFISHNSIYCKLDEPQKHVNYSKEKTNSKNGHAVRQTEKGAYNLSLSKKKNNEPVFKDRQPQKRKGTEELDESVVENIMKSGKKALKDITTFFISGL